MLNAVATVTLMLLLQGVYMMTKVLCATLLPLYSYVELNPLIPLCIVYYNC